VTLQGAPVAQEVAKDIETSAMQASLERQARLGENDDDSHGIWDFHFRSTARRTSRQGVSTFGRSGMSTPLSDADMPSLPAFCSFMDFGHNRYYDWGPATDPPPPPKMSQLLLYHTWRLQTFAAASPERSLLTTLIECLHGSYLAVVGIRYCAKVHKTVATCTSWFD